MAYWLFKTEPTTFSMTDLENAKNQTTFWEGVRNYQARNFLRDQVKKDDEVFVYHSSTDVPCIAGIAKVVREGYPDHTQFDSASKYYDPTSTEDQPRWYMVDIKHLQTFKHPLPLQLLREEPKLSKMVLLQKGSRLSIQPVQKNEWEVILKLIQ